MQKIAMYLRKSRAEEGENTEQVLSRHRALLTEYAKNHRLPLNEKDIYEEVVSGDSLFARPKMQQLLHAIEEGLYTGLLCVDIDRLGRGNMQEQGLILETLKDADCKIITPEKTYDLNDDLDETQTEFKTFFARQELKMIKKRLRRGLTATLEKGGHTGEVPFGYRRCYQGRIPTLEPDPEEAPYVKLAFDLYIKGQSGATIAEQLKNMGVKSHKGTPIAESSVRRMLQNPIYTGKIVWNQTHWDRPKHAGDTIKTHQMPKDQWLVVKGLHPAIVSPTVFDQAQTVRKRRAHPPYWDGSSLQNPLAGLLRCRKCGRSLLRISYPARRQYQHDQLVCPTKSCERGSRLDYVEQAIYAALREEHDRLQIRLTEPSRIQEQNEDREKIIALKREMTRLIHQKKRLYDLLEQAVYTVEVFTEREQEHLARIQAVDAQVKAIEQDQKTREAVIKDRIPKIAHILQYYWQSPPARRNKMLKNVIETIWYYKEKGAPPLGFNLEIEYHK